MGGAKKRRAQGQAVDKPCYVKWRVFARGRKLCYLQRALPNCERFLQIAHQLCVLLDQVIPLPKQAHYRSKSGKAAPSSTNAIHSMLETLFLCAFSCAGIVSDAKVSLWLRASNLLSLHRRTLLVLKDLEKFT